MDKNVVLYWSGGKDSAMALYEISTNPRYHGYCVTSLLTTFTEDYDRISGHGVRRSLLERQAACLGLNLHKTYITKTATMSEYESVVEEALLKCKQGKANVAATGDIFVEKRRMTLFKKLRMMGCFPLMLKDSREHVRKCIELGFQSYIVCVDSTFFDQSFVGRLFDKDFLDQLPPGVDPCGEYGEFHTFVFDGPIFKERVKCKLGEIVLRDSFYFSDIVLDD
jgi:uncharacterized protein (TIGR00290 family)